MASLIMLCLAAYTTKKKHNAKTASAVLGINWLDFHLSLFNGVVMTLPVIPVYTVSKRTVGAVKIEAVQVGVMTGFVPPGSLVFGGTIPAIFVVVSIFGAELHATMIRKGVTSSSWENIQEERVRRNKIRQHMHERFNSSMHQQFTILDFSYILHSSLFLLHYWFITNGTSQKDQLLLFATAFYFIRSSINDFSFAISYFLDFFFLFQIKKNR